MSTEGLSGVLPWAQARHIAATSAHPLPRSAARLDEAVGATLGADLVTLQDDPPADSADVDGHTGAQALKLHHSTLGADGKFTKPDQLVPTEADPGHDGLCLREQVYFEKAIRENLDLTAHLDDAVNSMRIVAAADQSFREGRTVNL